MVFEKDLPFACHIRFLTSSTLANKRLNRGMIGRYHNAFAGGPFFMLSSSSSSSSSSLSSLTLYRDTPHLGHLVNVLKFFL